MPERSEYGTIEHAQRQRRAVETERGRIRLKMNMSFFDPIENPEGLDLLQRILLVTDGTLTDTLEAAFLEKILLVRLSVDVLPAAEPVAELELDAGAPVMERQILLRGAATGVNYVYAESRLALDHIAPDFREQLLHSGVPLGRLWLEHRIETRKERLELFRRSPGELAPHFRIDPSESLLGRRYRVFNEAKPVMLISEYFPEHYRTRLP